MGSSSFIRDELGLPCRKATGFTSWVHRKLNRCDVSDRQASSDTHAHAHPHTHIRTHPQTQHTTHRRARAGGLLPQSECSLLWLHRCANIHTNKHATRTRTLACQCTSACTLTPRVGHTWSTRVRACGWLTNSVPSVLVCALHLRLSQGLTNMDSTGHFSYLGQLKGHNGWVTSLACPTDNQDFVLSSSRDKTIIKWNMSRDATGYVTGTPIRSLMGHSNFVEDIQLSSDGQFALSASWDASMRLWDLSNGQCTRKFTGHGKDVLTCAFSADNRQIVSGSRDQQMKVCVLLSTRSLSRVKTNEQCDPQRRPCLRKRTRNHQDSSTRCSGNQCGQASVTPRSTKLRYLFCKKLPN